MQTLVTLNAGNPNNEVVSPISCCDPRRAAAVLTQAPGAHDRRWVGRGHLVGGNRSRVVMETNVCSLAGVIRYS